MNDNLSISSFLLFILLFASLKIFSQDIDSSNSTHEQWEYTLETTGDILQLALPVSAGVTTIIKKDWQGTKQFAFSYATTIAITYGLKKITHKKRPEGRDLYDSFPSGHTASAFSGASFIQRRYGWKYGKWMYLLASVVAVSRMEGPDGWHDIWDVLGGAAVGIGSTYIFTKPYLQENIDIGFYTGNNSYLLTFNYTF